MHGIVRDYYIPLTAETAATTWLSLSARASVPSYLSVECVCWCVCAVPPSTPAPLEAAQTPAARGEQP